MYFSYHQIIFTNYIHSFQCPMLNVLLVIQNYRYIQYIFDEVAMIVMLNLYFKLTIRKAL